MEHIEHVKSKNKKTMQLFFFGWLYFPFSLFYVVRRFHLLFQREITSKRSYNLSQLKYKIPRARLPYTRDLTKPPRRRYRERQKTIKV